MRTSRVSAALAAAAFLLLLAVAPAAAVGTSFTYQGKLDRSSVPATSTCNFKFSLWNALNAGTQVGSTDTTSSVSVANGLFTVTLDFGAAFDGNPRWLEIAVQCSGDGGYTLLAPRQPITSTPYSIRSGFAENGGPVSSQWTTNGSSIFYNGGNVGIGASSPGAKLTVDGGTAAINPGYFTNNNASFAALGTANFAANGYGFYDGVSARHYLAGHLGIGVSVPVAQLHVVTSSATESAIYGVQNAGGWGIVGESNGSASGIGVYGRSPNGVGVRGDYTGGTGGFTAGVLGVNNAFNTAAFGVWGSSNFGAGVKGESAGGEGVQGTTNNASRYGGLFANTAGGVALKAVGKAEVGTLTITGGADLVERFDTGERALDPGTVVVIDDVNAGRLRAARGPYDPKVAGVVSGAGGIEAGIHLGQDGKLGGNTPVAMTGRVYVKCTAENGAIRPGDRLTTSSRSGHAMRATDASLSDGAVIGKAMSSLDSGTGLVLVLVNLQ